MQQIVCLVLKATHSRTLIFASASVPDWHRFESVASRCFLHWGAVGSQPVLYWCRASGVAREAGMEVTSWHLARTARAAAVIP